MKRQGVNFRHAVELLRADAGLAEFGTPKTPRSRAKLPAPVALDAGQKELLDQVIGYYHETLLASPEALAYLERRGLASRELVEQHRLGFANRTLGLRVPATRIKVGAEVRGRLHKAGILRESDHEHLTGCLGQCQRLRSQHRHGRCCAASDTAAAHEDRQGLPCGASLKVGSHRTAAAYELRARQGQAAFAARPKPRP